MSETTDLSIDMPSDRMRQGLMILYALLLLGAATQAALTASVSTRTLAALGPLGLAYTINFFGIFVRVRTACPSRKWSMTLFYFLKGHPFASVWMHVDAFVAQIKLEIQEEESERARRAEDARRLAVVLEQQREARTQSVLRALGCRTADELDRFRSTLDALTDHDRSERLDLYRRARGFLDAAPSGSCRSRVLVFLLEGDVSAAREEIARARTEAEAQREQERALQIQHETLDVMRARVEALSTTEHFPEAQRLLAQVEAQVAAKPRAFRLALHPLEQFLKRASS